MLYNYFSWNTIKSKFVSAHCTCQLGIWGSGSMAPFMLNIGTRWRLVVSFSPRPHYPPEMNHSPHRIRGWVDHTTGLMVFKKRKSWKILQPFHSYKTVCIKDLFIPLNKLTHFHVTYHWPQHQRILQFHVHFESSYTGRTENRANVGIAGVYRCRKVMHRISQLQRIVFARNGKLNIYNLVPKFSKAFLEQSDLRICWTSTGERTTHI
jgi:hypothetical protein